MVFPISHKHQFERTNTDHDTMLLLLLICTLGLLRQKIDLIDQRNLNTAMHIPTGVAIT